jgi:hypothetical protein
MRASISWLENFTPRGLQAQKVEHGEQLVRQHRPRLGRDGEEDMRVFQGTLLRYLANAAALTSLACDS